MTMDLGRVVAVHPEDNSVDLVMIANNARMMTVQVMSGAASGSTGLANLTEPLPANAADKWDRSIPTARDVIAVVGYIGRHPVVVGFLFPQVSQVLFARKNFRVERHASDVYSTLADDGSFEWSHPSGSYLRVAEDPEHEDLTGKDFDAKWATTRNTASAPWLSIMVKSGGVEQARVRIDPAGNVTVTHAGNLAAQTGGTAALTVTGNASVKAPQVTLDTPQAIVTGKLTVQGGLAVSGGAGATVTGDFAATGGAFTHGGKDVGFAHKHSGVASGSATSGVPV